MGFFDRWKKQPKQPPKEETPPRPAPAPSQSWPQLGDPLLDIAAIISQQDPWVMQWMDVCVNDIAGYMEIYYHLYVLRGLELEDDSDILQWIGLVQILIEANFVCERDWKDELTDFVHFINNLKGMKRLKLSLDRRWLSQHQNVPDWIESINSHWAAQGCCLSVIDIDSDSYVLFPCTLAERDRLRSLAQQLEQRIE